MVTVEDELLIEETEGSDDEVVSQDSNYTINDLPGGLHSMGAIRKMALRATHHT